MLRNDNQLLAIIQLLVLDSIESFHMRHVGNRQLFDFL